MRRLLPLLALCVATLLLGFTPTEGRSGGIPDVAKGGCVCHGADPSGDVTVAITGLPEAYAPGASYPITVSVTGPAALPVGLNQGGFALQIEAGAADAPAPPGALAPVDAATQVVDDVQATHTDAGNDARSWNLAWTAPANGTGPVSFFVSALAANGDALNAAGDAWNRANVTIPEVTPPAPEPEAAPPQEAPKETPGATVPLLAGALAATVALAALGRREPR